MGKVNKRFLSDKRLYSQTEYCLQFLRGLEGNISGATPRAPERYHLYWYGAFSSKQAFTVKSFLATQDLKNSELWLWLDVKSGYQDYDKNQILLPFLPFLHVKCFNPKVESQNTPLERRQELYRNTSLAVRSDFFRFVVLYKYGGIYIDMDVMFLRDMNTLLRDKRFQHEFCYRWASHRYGNSAILRLQQHSKTAHKLLNRCNNTNSCHPWKVLRFDDNADLDLLILPCPFFDPLWLHHDRTDKYIGAPFKEFKNFFRKFDEKFQRKPAIRSYRDFFPGALTYHWHNYWSAHEYKNSYFGRFNKEFDHILKARLGIRPQS